MSFQSKTCLLFVLLATTTSLPAPAFAEETVGSLCIPALPGASNSISDPPMTQEQYISPDGPLLLQVDSLSPVTVSPTSAGMVKDIPYKGRHLLTIRREGKIVTSFKFSFEKEHDKDLCLWYYAGYGTFSLRPAKECSCTR